jgi:hypothetical protein
MNLKPLAIIAAVSVAACSRDRQNAVDPSLAADLQAVSGSSASGALELAPASAKSRMVVSAIEGGPTAAPKRASVKLVARPTPRPAPRVAAQVEEVPVEAPAPTPAPAPVQQAPAPTQRQPGVYKSEAEIFRQMPWIKP